MAEVADAVAALTIEDPITHASTDVLDAVASHNVKVDNRALHESITGKAFDKNHYWNLSAEDKVDFDKQLKNLAITARHAAARDALAMLATCRSWHNALQTAQHVWLAFIKARFPDISLQSEAYSSPRALRLSCRDTYRCLLDVERLRSDPVCSRPPPSASATSLADFTFTFEGTLVPESPSLGSPVILEGLQAKPAYNGMRGRVITPKPNEAGRWGVRLTENRVEILLKPQNLRLVRQDFVGDDDVARGPTPFGSRQTWVGCLTPEELVGGCGGAPDVYFGSAYDGDWSDAATLLSVYVTTPELQTVKLYEARDDEPYSPCGGERGEQALYFQNKRLPYGRDEKPELCPELCIRANLDMGMSLSIFDEDDDEPLSSKAFVRYLRHDTDAEEAWWED